MEPSLGVVGAVWRETSRQPRLERLLAELVRVLGAALPVADVRVVRRPRVRALRSWAAAGTVRVHRDGDEATGPFALLGDRPPAGDWLAAPLPGKGGLAGVLFVSLRPGVRAAADHRRLVEALVEPIAVALRNERRMRSLDQRRAAAEADKVSALRRLDRDQLLDTIVGASTGLRGVMERVGLVARSDMPVLLFGETGSGKEVIARAIHHQSSRARGPFIRVNCAAISPELIDSELFGHERGAFTGAVSRRRGWFERAHEGTLLLDEIGELQPPAQVRLLRVLQDGTLERVGGERSVGVRVRIIAATHADLPAMVQNRRFREDLWYRISGFQIILPPLRERREDVPDLARYFAARAARHFGLRPLELSQEDLALLVAYDWPGNIRELATVMDRAVILGTGETLEVAKALGPALGGVAPGPRGQWPAPDAGAPRSAPPAPGGGPLPTFDDAMRAHIERALAVSRGRIEGERGAARLLAVNPHTLRARMRRLGIAWARFRE